MATLKERLDAIDNELKAAQAAYNSAVNNQESSAIVNKARARVNEAQKAYDLSAPQRSDVTPKAAVPVTATPAVKNAGTATTTGTATAIARPARVVEEDVPVDVNFADLPANQQTAIGAIGENAVVPGQKNVKSRTPKYDKKGKLIGYDVIYTDGTIASEGPDSADDEVITESGFNTDTIYTASDGTQFTDQQAYAIYQNDLTTRRLAGEAIAAEDLSKRTSAYDLLYNEFAQYGMGDLVADVKDFIMAGVSPSEFTMRLRETGAYKTRFKANEGRIKAGLAAISEAEYLELEDSYQNIMRNYGLPASYYTKGKYGVQEGFQKFIENDVSAVELEDRIMTAQQRVINSNPEVLASLKSF